MGPCLSCSRMHSTPSHPFAKHGAGTQSALRPISCLIERAPYTGREARPSLRQPGRRSRWGSGELRAPGTTLDQGPELMDTCRRSALGWWFWPQAPEAATGSAPRPSGLPHPRFVPVRHASQPSLPSPQPAPSLGWGAQAQTPLGRSTRAQPGQGEAPASCVPTLPVSPGFVIHFTGGDGH